MKLKLFAFISALFLLSSAALADEGYWPKSYFVSAGFGATVSEGDFNERAHSIKDTNGVKGAIHGPDISLFPTPDYTIGANIAQFTLALNFQIWTFNESLVGFKNDAGIVDETQKADSRIWRFGFEFTYNFFWPDFFQVGLGAGYSYTNMKINNSAHFKGDVYHTELTGSAVGLIANLHYYITDNISMVPAIKFYQNWFRSAYTSRTGTCDLDPYLWQTFIMSSVSVQYTF